MGSKHIAESLIEANKQITQLITKVESSQLVDQRACIDAINAIIRKLDHIVEELEKPK